ncbi:MAG: hypothetical protein K0R00_148 [Herbinix sp.]|jgi:hypothetical protein|nr:hypothetical protein [Herbinix sp.]
MANRPWEKSDVQFLRDKWGEMSIARIAKKLNRTVNAVKVKAIRENLTNALNHLDGVTLNQLAKVFGVSYGWIIKEIWIDQLNIPFKTKITAQTKAYRYICIDDFWKWAAKNKHRINFSKLEENILGKEPVWVAEKRKADQQNLTYKKTSIMWSKYEDSLLKMMLIRYKYTYPQISKRLGRTEGAIKIHIKNLGWPERPVKTEGNVRWSDEEINKLIEMKNLGYGNNSIGDEINRTARAVEHKLYYISKDARFKQRLAEHLRR